MLKWIHRKLERYCVNCVRREHRDVMTIKELAVKLCKSEEWVKGQLDLRPRKEKLLFRVAGWLEFKLRHICYPKER